MSVPLSSIPAFAASTRPAQDWIQPEAAFTKALAINLLRSGVTLDGIALNDLNATYINPALLTNNLGMDPYVVTPCDLSGNLLTTASVDAILEAYYNTVALGASGTFTLQIDTGNAPPSKEAGYYEWSIPGGYGSGYTTVVRPMASAIISLIFVGAIELADSTETDDGLGGRRISIGTSDTPTPAQVVAKIVTLWPSSAYEFGNPTANGDILEVTVPAAWLTTYGMLGDGVITAGGNSWLRSLLDGGATISYNNE